MTKKHAHLFENVAQPVRLFESYRRARRGLCSKTEANMFAERLEENIFALRQELLSGRYQFGPYRHFKVRDPKERLIHVAPFADRVVHHAINDVIGPIFEASFIDHSYACRVGKGNALAVKRLQKWLDGDPDTYVLMLDIKKFFANVDRNQQKNRR